MMKNARRRQILLIEDESAAALERSSSIEDLGYQVTLIHNGRDALAACANQPDLVLVDFDLAARAGGAQAAGEADFQEFLRQHSLPVVFLVSHLDQDVVAQIRSITRCGFVPGDAHPLVLQSAIEMALELFAAQQQLKHREQGFQSLVENLPVEVYRTDPAGNTIYVNQYWRQVTGLTADQYLGLGWLQSVHPDDRERVAEGWRCAFRAGQANEMEYRCARDGRIFWVLDQAVPEYDAAGRLVGYIGTSTDITRQKQMEEQLTEYREAVEASVDMIVVVDQEYVYRMANRAFLEYRQLDLQAVIGHPVEEVIGSQLSQELILPNLDRCLQGESIDFELVNTYPGAGKRIIQIAFSPLSTTAGGRRVVITTRDITQRKQAELALQESEIRYRSLFDHSLDGIILSTNDGQILAANPSAYFMLGRSEQELLQLRRGDVVNLSDPRFQPSLEHRQRTGTFRGELLFTRQDGTSFPVEVSTASFSSLDGEQQLAIIFRDITRRKQAEQALVDSERHFRELFETSRDGINYTDIQGHYISANQAFLDLLGFSGLDELRTMTYLDITPPEYFPLEARIIQEQMLVRGYCDEYEKEYFHTSGERIPVSLRIWHRYSPDGQRVGEWAVVRDIRERKQAEKALKESERQFRDLFETSRDGIVYADMQGRFLAANQAFLNLLGFAGLEELQTRTYLEFTAPEYWLLEKEVIQQQVARRGYSDEYEKEYIHKSGERIPVNLIVWQRRSADGQLLGEWALVRDIRERKRVESALIESERQFRELFETSRDGIAFVDRQGHYLAANPVYLNLLGYASLGELSTKTYLDITPAEYWPLEARIYQEQVNVRGYSEEFEKEYFHKSGERIPVSVCIWQRRDADGQVEGEWAVVRDIRERKRVEREIHRLLDEKDMLLHEVHHRIKNNMTTISGLLSMQAGILDDPQASQALEEASGRVQSMMAIYDILYRSGDFQRVDLEEFLSTVVDGLASTWQMPGRDIWMEHFIEKVYVPTGLSLPLGIVINELVTNAYKYAFSGRSTGRVSVAVWLGGGMLRVAVADDGVGLPAEVDVASSTSFGLNLVRVLVRQLKGSLQVERNSGTTFHLAVPLEP